MEHPILSRVELVSAAEIGDPEPGHFTGYRNQHLVLPREPGSRARRPGTRKKILECAMPEEKITATEARQATMRPRAMVLVLFASLFLCLMAGLGIGLAGSVSHRCLSNKVCPNA